MYYILKFLCYIPFKLLCITKVINKKNLPKKGQKLIISCNHQSFFDIVILGMSLPYKIHFIAKKELKKNFFMRCLFRWVNAIVIDRENMDFESLKKIIKLLKENKVVCIFPEGTRNKTEDMALPFKQGIEVISQKTNTPILVTAIGKNPGIFRKNKLYIGEVYICEKGKENLKELENQTAKLIREE